MAKSGILYSNDAVRVTIKNHGDDHYDILAWCNKIYGKRTVNWDRLYDSNGKWRYCFETEQDATAFLLRWA